METSECFAGFDPVMYAPVSTNTTPRHAPAGTAPRTSELSFAIKSDDATHVVVAVAGEIDMATAPKLARALRMHVDCDVTLDLSAVRFLDAAGFAVLVHAYNALHQTGHTLRTTGESDIVLTAMRIVGLMDIFHGRSPD